MGKLPDADFGPRMDFYEAEELPKPKERTDNSIPVVLSQYERNQEEIRWTWDPGLQLVRLNQPLPFFFFFFVGWA